MLTFVCWRWHNPYFTPSSSIKYTAQHVNVLNSMLKRHYNKPFELVCVTDDPTKDIDNDVRLVPMWDDLFEYGRCYTRLKCFAPEMAYIIAPEFVSIDLDVVITEDITDLFDEEVDFKVWSARPELGFMPFCGSLFQMKAGAMAHVWDLFSTDDLIYGTHDRNKKEVWFNSKSVSAGFHNGSDQAWIAYCLYPTVPIWTPEDDGIYVFNAHIRKQDRYRNKTIWVKDNTGKKVRKKKRVLVEGECRDGTLPDNAKMVFFPGPHDPTQRELQRAYPWIGEHYW